MYTRAEIMTWSKLDYTESNENYVAMHIEVTIKLPRHLAMIYYFIQMGCPQQL